MYSLRNSLPQDKGCDGVASILDAFKRGFVRFLEEKYTTSSKAMMGVRNLLIVKEGTFFCWKAPSTISTSQAPFQDGYQNQPGPCFQSSLCPVPALLFFVQETTSESGWGVPQWSGPSKALPRELPFAPSSAWNGSKG